MENFFTNLNWVDLIFTALLVYFVITNSGFIHTLIEVLGFFMSLLVSYLFYSSVSPFYIDIFNIPPGYSNVLGFFTVWFLFEFMYFLVSFFILKKFLRKIENVKLDKYLGILAGAVQAVIVFIFFVSLVFALPVRGQIKKEVLSSKTGPFFVSVSRSFESNLKEVFGQAAQETLNFLTVKPDSTSSVSLGFKTEAATLLIDPISENILVSLVNFERERLGLKSLSVKKRPKTRENKTYFLAIFQIKSKYLR